MSRSSAVAGFASPEHTGSLLSSHIDGDKSRPRNPMNPPRPSDTSPELAVSNKASPFAKSWVHFLAGGIGGMTAATLTAPLDVLKTRLQSDFYQAQLRTSRAAHAEALGSMGPLRAASYHLRETMQILASVYRIEGPRALFKGLGANLAGVVPARSIHFYTYGNGKRLISTYANGGQESAWVHLTAAVMASVATSTATNPIWVVKTRMQLDKSQSQRTASGMASRQYSNSFDCVRKMVRTEGFGALYKGMSASYLGAAETALQWVLYEQMMGYMVRRERMITAQGREKSWRDNLLHGLGTMSAAGVSKLIATIATYPHEVARTRLRQGPTENGQLKYTGLAQCFRVVWREEGLVGLYGGMTPHLLRTVPSAIIMFGMYEGILRVFNIQSRKVS